VYVVDYFALELRANKY